MIRRGIFVTVLAAVGFVEPACKPVPLTAPDGAELAISANPSAIPISGGVSIITVVGFKAPADGGGPLPDGTQIFFTTNVGTIEERVEMINGIAEGHLRSTGRAGVANVVARSGSGITASLGRTAEDGTSSGGVLIGNANGITIQLVASPATVTEPDFASELAATVFDADNNRMSGVPIIFRTSAGALASQGTSLRTNENGQAFDRLTLANFEDSAQVTAISGAVTSEAVTVTRAVLPPPIVTSIAPTSADRGVALNVTIRGLNFRPGALVSFEDGVAINSVTFVNSTTLEVSITTDSSATTGARDVTVTNPDGQQGTLAGAFQLGSVPIITGVNPTTLGSGNNQPITIIGVNFAPGAFVTFSGTGITVVPGTISVNATGTMITLQINIAVGATGQRSVTVTNPDGGSGTLANAFEPT